jgi:hypothetical protein
MVVGGQNVYHFGNLSRNAVVGPNFRDVDMSLTKTTKITERLSNEFRVEAFDLFSPQLRQSLCPRRRYRRYLRRDQLHSLPERRLRLGPPIAVRAVVYLLEKRDEAFWPVLRGWPVIFW